MKFPAVPTLFVVSLLLIGGGASSVAGAATTVKKPSSPVAAKPAPVKPAPVKSTAPATKKPALKPAAKVPGQTKKPVAVTRPVKPPAPIRRQTATVVRNAPRKAPVARPRTIPVVATSRSKPPEPKVPVIARNTSEFIDISYPEPGVRKSSGATAAVATRR